MARHSITWILVADGARARVFRRVGPAGPVAELEEGCFEGERRPSRELGGDRPGRTFDSAGPGRHAMEPPSDPHRLAETAFLREVTAWLSEREREGAFERLILVAAPRALGELRRLLPPALAQRVVEEVASDLTRAEAAEIARRFSGPPAG